MPAWTIRCRNDSCSSPYKCIIDNHKLYSLQFVCLYVILSSINEACTPMCWVTPSITIIAMLAALSRGDDNAHIAISANLKIFISVQMSQPK